jgi:hypothetical protein
MSWDEFTVLRRKTRKIQAALKYALEAWALTMNEK